MPSVSLSSGEVQEIYESDSAGERLFMRCTSGEARYAKSEAWARSGRSLKAGESQDLQAGSQGERLYLYGVEDGTTVTWQRQGWFASLFGPRQVETDITAQSVGSLDTGVSTWTAGTIETDITAQSVGDMDVNLSGSSLTSNLDMNISNSDITVPQNTQVISANSVVEVNADQTVSVGPNSSASTTVRANSGEVWRLSHIRLHSPEVDNVYNQENSHQFTVKTESQGVGLATGESSDATPLTYDEGKWVRASGRDNLSDVTIDGNNGLTVTYTNNNANHTQTSTREIRMQFEVTKVA